MNKLTWKPMQAVLPGVQQWGAQNGAVTYIITKDSACIPDDTFYNRFAVSSRMVGSKTDHLGVYDTLEEAKSAAEATR